MTPPSTRENGQDEGRNMMNPFRGGESENNSDGYNEESGGEEDDLGDEVDPRELKQVLSEIKRLQGDVKRLTSQAKKAKVNGTVAQELETMSQELAGFAAILAGAEDADKRGAIEEFRDGEYFEKINEIRAKIEVPQSLKKLAQAVKKLEKSLKTKAVKALGLNLEGANAAVAEIKQKIQAVQELFNSGEYEDARAELREIYENGGPQDIESAILRIRDAKTALKRAREETLRQKIQQMLDAAISAFNNGEYQEAVQSIKF